MVDFLKSLWEFEIQLAPVCIALAAVYVPTLVRRATHVEYVPLYFSAYPLRSLNDQLYEVYAWRNLRDTLSEDPEVATGFEREHWKFRRQALVSYAIDAVFIPLTAGAVIGTFLSRTLLGGFLVILLIVKAVELGKSLVDFNRNNRGRQGIALVAGSYAAYVVLLFLSLRFGYNWMRPFADTGSYLDAMDSAVSSIFQELLLPTIVVLAAVYLIMERLLNTDMESTADVDHPSNLS